MAQVVGVTKEERVEIKLREIKGLLVAMMQCGRLKVPEEQRQYQAVNGDLSKARPCNWTNILELTEYDAWQQGLANVIPH